MPSPSFCDGMSRRAFLKVGALGFGGLSLPNLLRLRARFTARGRSRHYRPPCR